MLSVERAEQIAAAIELPDWVVEKSAAWTYASVGFIGDSFQDSVMTRFPQMYMAVQNWVRANEHPFVSRLPYLNPWHSVASILGYFTMIVAFRLFGRVLGKFSCRHLGLLHNLGLHLLSLYMSVGLMISARAAGYTLWNNAAGTSHAEWRIAKLIWLFYVSKVVEWVDTLIMLLKQNYHQVSFLHVYHHATIFAMWWLATLKAPAGEAYYSAMVNSGIHVVMYGYYFLTLLFPSGTVRNILNKLKFVITKGQMTQFTFNCLQSIYDLLWVPRAQLKYSAPLLQALFWYMISLLVLFGNFLRKNSTKAHHRRHHHHQTAARQAAEEPKGIEVGKTNENRGVTKAHTKGPEYLHERRNGAKGKSA
ncbi:long chain polyunsaturated fatty acid elongation enzyme-like protein [Leptomonas seymouri]|uniref:Elongation of fatty acids protein n=1 Tax=Leptomonas seymouri TaxID=5684 RepID=A0A0N0P994_LEPSE|nr:long chain polyunsaturated fatty acid elongation enzyme-like protein [Leptomonas seymouri]|eukprot:KPI90849.1 long chain polyunsaturated fatty acid elongation enzyme-like protein [Leptomonas seymouri]